MSVTLQNQAVLCVQDTLRLLLDEAAESRANAVAERGQPGEAFAVGRAEALVEALHTWANQLKTFGLDAELNGVWGELQEFLGGNGY